MSVRETIREVTSVIDLLLNIDVVIVVVFIEVETYMMSSVVCVWILHVGSMVTSRGDTKRMVHITTEAVGYLARGQHGDE